MKSIIATLMISVFFMPATNGQKLDFFVRGGTKHFLSLNRTFQRCSQTVGSVVTTTRCRDGYTYEAMPETSKGYNLGAGVNFLKNKRDPKLFDVSVAVFYEKSGKDFYEATYWGVELEGRVTAFRLGITLGQFDLANDNVAFSRNSNDGSILKRGSLDGFSGSFFMGLTYPFKYIRPYLDLHFFLPGETYEGLSLNAGLALTLSDFTKKK